MSALLGNFLQTYLLYPILGLLLTGLGVFIAKDVELSICEHLVGVNLYCCNAVAASGVRIDFNLSKNEYEFCKKILDIKN